MDSDPVVATVDGDEIRSGYFQTTYVDYLIASGENDTRRNRYSHLNNLIDISLLAKRAERDGLAEDSVLQVSRERETKKALGGAWYEDAFLRTLPELTDAEMRTAFALSKEKRVVRHLFFRSNDAADAAYARLRSGRRFVDEAQDTYGLIEFDSSAGNLGVIRFYQVEPAFAEAAFSTPVDSFSEPVRSRFGYHIVQVDEAIRNPLITESEYQTHKEGVASKYRLHRRMMEGDRFVRSFMENLDVVVDDLGIRKLTAALRELENSVEPKRVEIQPGVEVGALDLRALREGLQPSTVLLRYRLDGTDRQFTAGDYYLWLPELPFQEARSRAAASVGRALRNEVFAEMGRREGLDSDSRVATAVSDAIRIKLADAERGRLRTERNVDATETELRSYFEHTGLSKKKNWRVSFWHIPFGSRSLALKARDRIRTNPETRRSFAGYATEEKVLASDMPKWYATVGGAAPGTIETVSFGPDEWHVFSVEAKSPISASFEDVREELASAIQPLLPEYRMIRQLRDAAVVRIDSVAFEDLMLLEPNDSKAAPGAAR